MAVVSLRLWKLSPLPRISFSLGKQLARTKTDDMAVNIGGMRKPYRDKGDIFDVKDLASMDPFAQFESWFQDAQKDDKTEEPNAMCLATATKSGLPSCRMVLLKSYGTPTKQDVELDPDAGIVVLSK